MCIIIIIKEFIRFDDVKGITVHANVFFYFNLNNLFYLEDKSIRVFKYRQRGSCKSS